MAFEGLSSRLQNVFGKLRGKGKAVGRRCKRSDARSTFGAA